MVLSFVAFADYERKVPLQSFVTIIITVFMGATSAVAGPNFRANEAVRALSQQLYVVSKTQFSVENPFK